MKVLEYDIILTDSFDDLAEAINEKLKAGWSLQGGVAIAEHLREANGISPQESHYSYAQAIVKEGEK